MINISPSFEALLISLNIRKLRKERKLSLNEMACLAKVTKQTLYKLETNCYSSRLSTFIKVAIALNIRLYKLFDY